MDLYFFVGPRPSYFELLYSFLISYSKTNTESYRLNISVTSTAMDPGFLTRGANLFFPKTT